MEGSLSTLIYVSVAILVTLSIAAAAFAVFSQVGDIIATLSSQEMTLKEIFDEVHEQYDGQTLNGVDLINTLRRYRYIDLSNLVIVTFDNSNLVKNALGDEAPYDIADGVSQEEITTAIDYVAEEMETLISTNFKYENKYIVTVKTEPIKIVDGADETKVEGIVINFQLKNPVAEEGAGG